MENKLKMRILIRNIMGSGQISRGRQLKEIMVREQVDIVGVQETIKQDFSVQYLARFDPGAILSGNGCRQSVTQGDPSGGERQSF